MRSLSVCVAAALFALPTSGSSYSTPSAAEAGPPTIPYMCADGHEASVIYESGSDYRHAKALVTYDGRTLELHAAPTLYGVRYRGAGGEDGPAMAWSLRGEQAVLTESPDEDGYTREEREIARCVRVRGGNMAQADASHGEAH